MDPQIMMLMILSTILGIIIGALPGLTATMGIALLTGITFGLPAKLAIPILVSIYDGAIFGGSISAVLINIPGTPASAATALDGYPLAKQGKAKEALFLTRFASFLGSLFGMLCLLIIAPQLSKIALQFTSPEFTLLALFGITICGSLTSPDLAIKGWIAGFLGILVSCIGMDGLHGFPRFTFGIKELLGGIAYVPAMIGVFGIPQVLISLRYTATETVEIKESKTSLLRLLKIVKDYIVCVLRSGVIGVYVGTIPGVGEDVASWLSYDTAKRSSKHPEQFGKGAYEGIIASETANNACIGGAIIPLLTLGIPGSPPAAVLLGALLLHGVRPGPMLQFEFPNFIYEMSALLALASFLLLVCGSLMTSILVPILRKTKNEILMPIVAALCVIGAYAINVSLFDIKVMVILGLIGYLLVEMGYPMAPFVLGVILGPMIDVNLRRTLLTSNGSILPFITRPLSIILLILVLLSFITQTSWWKNLRRKEKKTA
jgi:putative tricarboxylic transport membrane protein